MSDNYEYNGPRVLGAPGSVYLNVTGLTMKQVRSKIRQFADLYEVDFRDVAFTAEGFWSIKHDKNLIRFVPRGTQITHLSHQTFYTAENKLRPLSSSQKMNEASLVSVLVMYWAKAKAPTWVLSRPELNRLQKRGLIPTPYLPE